MRTKETQGEIIFYTGNATDSTLDSGDLILPKEWVEQHFNRVLLYSRKEVFRQDMIKYSIGATVIGLIIFVVICSKAWVIR